MFGFKLILNDAKEYSNLQQIKYLWWHIWSRPIHNLNYNFIDILDISELLNNFILLLIQSVKLMKKDNSVYLEMRKDETKKKYF